MTEGKITKAAGSEIHSFAKEIRSMRPANKFDGRRGRLLFAMDATASREPTWDRAAAVQSEMFVEAERHGGLEVQLVFYRGFGECKASKWTSTAGDLVSMMTRVRCLAGRTQISRVLRHALKETQKQKVDALVLVTDACEEDVDEIGELAGQLALHGTVAFAFQEGMDKNASIAMSSIARLTRGAHLRLQDNSASELRALLAAVASFASGGHRALTELAQHSAPARRLISARKG